HVLRLSIGVFERVTDQVDFDKVFVATVTMCTVSGSMDKLLLIANCRRPKLL
ncbi:hypothetical protein MKW98_003185, partial [Papaver atlanticum]